jgi:N4-gp56 family major capsid protein
MAAVTTTNPADFADRIQTYFNPKLLKALEFELVLASYALRQAYPANGTSIRFFRPRAANTTGVQALTEGGADSGLTLTEVAVGYVDVPLSQRGAASKISDLTQAVDLLNTVQLYVETMGGDAALDLDTVARNALVAGILNSDETYRLFERFAGVEHAASDVVDSSDDFTTFNALSASNAKMTRTRHLAMVTQLRQNRVPMIGGKYVALIAPAVMHDVRQDVDWVAAAVNYDNQALYKRGTIMLDGCVFVEHDNAFREANTYGTHSASGSNYASIYLGREAFGCPELSNKRAGGSPMGPRMTILNQADKADILNRNTFIGWKAYYGAKPFITNVSGEVPHYAILRTKSTFV